MARRTYRQRRRYRKTGRWSANIQRLNQSGTAPAQSIFGDFFDLATNPGQSNSTVSQQYTVKNIEIAGQLEANASSNVGYLEELTYYIMYVPEGYPLDLNIPFNHPEWIMAYKYAGQSAFGSSSSGGNQPPKITTRLSRRLNTGDRIVFMYTAQNTYTNSFSVKFQGLVRWWTKAN